ncbi:hypothetical protein KCG44_02175 [Pacificimonas sp. WHA3]|uniref:Uncharacterized protein n=1 Tax=Pacificimonas pallii TaxID=2827236 RepID=A0ABS6SCK4_9SPHN|nr:hypothetical protein [Pacificimonas pallii]MBV7255587.1 hypothetical protein [Pacificimonas pallii]
MGLYVSSLKSLPYAGRSLYVYLLDYGWPDDDYAALFKRHFLGLANRASETEAIVVASERGIHFANEVFDWHSIVGLDANQVLPAIMISTVHPHYFERGSFREDTGEAHDLVLIPLREACTSPDEFLQLVGSIFDDLERGLTLRQFAIAKKDRGPFGLVDGELGLVKRSWAATILQPNFMGVGVDLKKLFSKDHGKAR